MERAMEVKQILHMNKGNGDTSYAQNSQFQSKILSIATPIIHEAIQEMVFSSNVPIESMGIADLGCSSGPNTLSLISYLLDVVIQVSSKTTEFRVLLNDLFSNDFNSIIMSLPEFYNNQLKRADQFVFISAVPGSFYGRLFPAKSLHFVNSSTSLQWLSRVPAGLGGGASTNKGKIYMSKTSPESVLDAYSLQFRNDFSAFLKCRAEEIVGGGRMVLSIVGRPSHDRTCELNCDQWDLLADALMSMVSKGAIEEEKVDSFNLPFYAPCAEELKLELQKEGLFQLDRLETFEIDGGAGNGQQLAKGVRAVTEPMLESHFGSEIIDDLFRRYAELLADHLSKSRSKAFLLVISLIR